MNIIDEQYENINRLQVGKLQMKKYEVTFYGRYLYSTIVDAADKEGAVYAASKIKREEFGIMNDYLETEGKEIKELKE